MESMRKKLIGYVSGRDFPLLIDKDIRSLDVINIAFGAVENDRVIYKLYGVKRAASFDAAIEFQLLRKYF